MISLFTRIQTWALTSLFLTCGLAAGEAPTVLQQPEDQAALAGSTVDFNAVISGDQPLRLQWRAYLGHTFTNFPGATQSTLTLSNIASNLQVALWASNDFGSVTSRVASFTVLRPASFSREPSSVVAVEGAQATFSSLGVGTGPMRYQWFLEGQPIPDRKSVV